jgi:translation initiation factor 4G
MRRLKLKQEEERILTVKQEEKVLRLAQERAKEEKERKEKEEREEQERSSKLAEATRLRLEEEAAAKAKAKAISEPEPEEREEAELEAQQDGKDVDTETSKSMEGGKDKPKGGLRINTTSINSPDKRRPGPLDITRYASSVVALAAARFIADITTVSYPEGYHSPHPDLNQNVKNGKFRYH